MTDYTFECVRTNIASAIYYLTDMIIFETYKDLTNDEVYLCMTITKDDETSVVTTIYKWRDVPKYVMDIYKYVSSTSCLVADSPLPGCYKLYGNHIGRTRDYKMHLASFSQNPIDQSTLHILRSNDFNILSSLSSLSSPSSASSASLLSLLSSPDDALVQEICQTMTDVKKL